jgi:tRNA nucleotidyltransferase (CCA-adding enzyme)
MSHTFDVILTHNSSDFDAVGAQVAASKLWPQAYVVRSTHLRRNVRHFLTLYGAHLPFVHRKDLPKGRVERALIVDSQHWQQLSGMTNATTIEIIDHHTPTDHLREGWTRQIEETGAATTLVVERIREQGAALNPIEATLVLLGIYADTGSLTYGMTTSRDIYAAGWVLEQGAMLDVVREFLSQPLSEEQLLLYEELLDNVQMHTYGGSAIAVAASSAHGFRGDIAGIAHQLRDLLDPSALFLLIDLDRHVQLVARGTEDVVNVGAIARAFGGGGHPRAAAARIREKSLSEALSALFDTLDEYVTPGVFVGDLMSTNVHTLRPDQRVDEAFRVMVTYGHEGYPVVDEKDRVVGLATRRAIDRAMNHGLEGIKVAEVMEGGTHGVQPDDPLMAVRQVMVEHGWGQVPVMEEDGTLLGIITRTDLIKQAHKMDRPSGPTAGGLADQLTDALAPPVMAMVRRAGEIAAEHGARLYVVGGFVRDLLLERPTVDLDFVVEGDAITIAHALAEELGGRVVTHEKFRTANWFPEGEHQPQSVDFATARREFYTEPTSLPTVESGGIKLDLHRRDFTINTLAIRLDPAGFGNLLDYYGGLADLRTGRIRALHSMSFVDDPTRMLRAVRYEQRFGFTMEQRTEGMIGRWHDMLDRVSGDRIRHEVERLLAEPTPEKGLRRLDDLGILAAIHPALTTDERTEAAFAALRALLEAPPWEPAEPIDEELAMFAVLVGRLPLEEITAISERLKVRRATTQGVERTAAAWQQLRGLPSDPAPSAVDAALHGASDTDLAALWSLADDTLRPLITRWAAEWRHLSPYTDGDTLKAMGLQPGPHFGVILRQLRRAWLDGDISSREEEETLRETLIAEHG